MKSEKAKEIINDGSCHVSDGILLDGHRIGCADLVYYGDAIAAISAAEQEAEERMRNKATKAYCHDCCCTVRGVCEISPDKCLALQGFIQKLNEE